MYQNYKNPDRVSYYDWMMREYPDGGASGNTYERRLADDIRVDTNFPKRADYAGLLKYLTRAGATEDVVEIFKASWARYLVAEQNRKAQGLY